MSGGLHSGWQSISIDAYGYVCSSSEHTLAMAYPEKMMLEPDTRIDTAHPFAAKRRSLQMQRDYLGIDAPNVGYPRMQASSSV